MKIKKARTVILFLIIVLQAMDIILLKKEKDYADKESV